MCEFEWHYAVSPYELLEARDKEIERLKTDSSLASHALALAQLTIERRDSVTGHLVNRRFM
jgi:hypothetical protein